MRYLVFLLALAGCVSAEQRQANIEAHFGPRCEAMGNARYSTAWDLCIGNLRAEAARSSQQGAQTFQGMQPTMTPVPLPQPPAPQAPVRTYCRPDGTGGVNCITR